MRSLVYKWININQVNRCLLCLGSAAGSPDCICPPCLDDLPWLGPACRQCALPLSAEGLLCGKCQQRPPAFSQVIAPLHYRFPIDSLIPAFKHQHRLTWGRLLVRLLQQAIIHHYRDRQLQLPDVVIPLPLHRSRQARRGFNQAMELARPIARALDIPLDYRNLLRRRATTAQQGLDARARQRNLRDAFICRHPARLAGRHLALVDDVMTTGTTVNEASRTLLQAGAASVTVWCVARVDAPDNPTVTETDGPAERQLG